MISVNFSATSLFLYSFYYKVYSFIFICLISFLIVNLYKFQHFLSSNLLLLKLLFNNIVLVYFFILYICIVEHLKKIITSLYVKNPYLSPPKLFCTPLQWLQAAYPGTPYVYRQHSLWMCYI